MCDGQVDFALKISGVSKKIKKPIKPRKIRKKNYRKNQTVKKTRLNRLKFKKTDQFGSVSVL
jgi:hypothetical protein